MIYGSVLLKFVKSCVVGCSGMVIDFAVTWALKDKLHINKYIANSCGFALAASSNYVWNRVWAFESRSVQVAREYLLFFAVALVGLGINNLILWLLADKLKLNFYLSKAAATGIVCCWNFGMNFWVTFR